MAEFPHTVSEALLLLNEELIKQTPCVARSSVAMGVLQERLLTQSGGEGSLQVSSSSSNLMSLPVYTVCLQVM